MNINDAVMLMAAGWSAEEITADKLAPIAVQEVTPEMGQALIAARNEAQKRYAAEVQKNQKEDYEPVLSEFCFGEFWYGLPDGSVVCLDNTASREDKEIATFGAEFASEDAAKAWLGYGVDYKVAVEVDSKTCSLRDAVATAWDDPDKMMGIVEATWEQGRISAREGQEQPGKERSGEGQERKPGELKAAAGKPKAAVMEAATPSEDGRACSASAAARGVDAQKKSNPEKRK